MKNATRRDIERTCMVVYEHYTGKCWHVRASTCDDNWLGKTCKKCQIVNPDINPPLATSLDAWAEHIWPRIWNPNGIPIAEQITHGSTYALELSKCCGSSTMCFEETEFEDMGEVVQMDSAYFMATAKPIHHLEAALRACGKYDEWEGAE